MSDMHLRQQALAPNQSFIVQAPAGSGKTELLVQRFLVLLANVENAPEEIVALTFTRKAAIEMRQRILQALQLASQAAPTESHAYNTWQLAKAALKQDQSQQWNLCDNPGRLRIQTIDAFCANLTRQMPLLSGLGGQTKIAENAADIYVLAARQLLTHLEEQLPWSSALSELLLHVDNRVALLEQLLVGMLARRDQWLPYLITPHKNNRAALRSILERGLRHISQEALQTCERSLPVGCVTELLNLLAFAVANRQLNLEIALSNWQTWLAIADLLLTKENTWRASIDKRQGFPADNKLEKARMTALLKQLSTQENLRCALQQLRSTPPPAYTPAQWQMLEVLIEILPILVAQLHVIFHEKGLVDFTEISLAALRALGDSESPSDLALLLDYQLRHILVDEFQDTSTTQYRLLEQLICGWQAGDGRSIFVVGDPMQSIYRFRQAEVGLFLKTQQQGIGQLSLKSIQLQANFRSTPTLIAWVNTQFKKIFPAQADISFGATAFNSSISTRADSIDSQVSIYCCADTHTSTTAVLNIVTQEIKKDPEQTVAILVRSRAHLVEIIAALKFAQIKFHAVEMQSLAEQEIVQDLIALTCALLHLGDRLAWLSILRAPWCGLTLTDLYFIAGHNQQQAIWAYLKTFSQLEGLSDDGRQRLGCIVPILNHSIAQRGRIKLRELVEATWKALNGPACVKDPAELITAMSYFDILEELQSEMQGIDQTSLITKISQRYTKFAADPECKLVVMTIHKAKGLEFDTVILPHLQRKNRAEETQLLLWFDRPRRHAANDLILAPIKSQKAGSDPIYDYLREVEKIKSRYEITRLLYVAVTRAKKNLYLLAEMDSNKTSAPSKDSFLSLLWPLFEQQYLPKKTTTEIVAHLPETEPIRLRRLCYADMGQSLPLLDLTTSSLPMPMQLMDNSARKIGTLIHRILQQINEEGLTNWHIQKISLQKNYWRKCLLQAGIMFDQLQPALAQIERAISQTLQDPRGRWILMRHAQEHNEWALTTSIEGKAESIVIDRSFVDEQDIRWIIDFKTSADDTESAQHRLQLEKYAFVLRQSELRAIRLGIYFPTLGAWREWAESELKIN